MTRTEDFQVVHLRISEPRRAPSIPSTTRQEETTWRPTLRVSSTEADAREYLVSIPNEAFLSNRVRYQDGPQICFLKLERELIARGDKAKSKMKVTDQELDEFRDTHTKKPQQHRPRPQVKP